jgi:hypothetical protein
MSVIQETQIGKHIFTKELTRESTRRKPKRLDNFEDTVLRVLQVVSSDEIYVGYGASVFFSNTEPLIVTEKLSKNEINESKIKLTRTLLRGIARRTYRWSPSTNFTP